MKEIDKILADDLRLLLERVSDGIVSLDNQMNYTYVNEAGGKLLGRKPEDLIGKNYWNEFPEAIGTPFANAYIRSLDTQKTVSIEEYYQPWDRWFSNTIYPSDDGITIIFQEITEKKKAEKKVLESKQIIEGIINTIPARVFWKDINLVFLGCNSSFANDAGFSDPKDIIGKDDFQMGWHNEAEKYRNDDLAVLNNNQPKYNIEETQTTPKGEKITLLTSKIPLKNANGEVIGVLGTYLDITERKEAMDKILEKDIQFRKLSAQVPDLICQFTRRYDGTYFVPIASDGIKNIFGFSPEDVRESFAPIANVIYQDDFDRVISEIEYSAKHLTLFLCEFRVQVPGKSIQWMYAKASPEKLTDGNITWYGFVTNITKQKQDEQERVELNRLNNQIIESISEGVVIYDNNLIIKTFNPFMEKLSGVSASAVLGKHPMDIFPFLEDFGVIKNLKEAVKEKISKIVDIPFSVPNTDKKGWCSYSISSVFNQKSEIIGAITIVRDITESKKTEEKIISAMVRAEQSERLKSAFLANMSHEIRTPMNGILGFAELLKEPTLTAEEREEYIEIIEKSGNRMLNMINDIINISKVESGHEQIFISEANITSKIEHITAFFRPEAEAKGLQILVKNKLSENDAIIKTDREKVYAILTNLIKNAIKFTDIGSIKVGCEKKGRYLEFSVKDSGVGILNEQKELVFERFRQGNETLSRKQEGAGLGLSISKAYVEMLGGKIWVESETGKGTTFYFTIPFLQE